MKNTFTKLIHIGIHSRLNSYEAQRLRVFNYCVFFGLVASLTRLIYISWFSTTDYTPFTILINVLPVLLCLVMLTFTYLGRYKTATAISFIFFPPVLFLMYTATLDTEVGMYLMLYFIFPFFFLHRSRSIMIAFSVAALSLLGINQGSNLNLLFYSSEHYPEDMLLSYFDYFFSIIFVFIALYAIKFIVWSYEKSLRKKREELKELNFFKDKLFTIISHDLRSPIAATSQLIDILEHQEVGQQEFKTYMGELKETVGHTRELVDNLLHWARNQMKQREMTPAPVDTRQLVEEVLISIERQAVTKNVRLINEASEEPQPFADGETLRIIIRNLVVNAIKFTRPGDFVKVTTQLTEGNFIIGVQDSGIGIPREKQAMLLKQIHFTTSGTAREKGSGIGLMICRDLTERNKGTLTFTSEPGIGTTFFITLPLPPVPVVEKPAVTTSTFSLNPHPYAAASYLPVSGTAFL